MTNLVEVSLPEYNNQFISAGKRKSADIKDLYIFAKQNNYRLLVDITYAEYAEVCNIFNSLVTKYITEEGSWIKMPYGLGEIGITKFMPRYYKPRFKKEGVELYQNPHSQGFVCKFSWKKDKVRMKDIGLLRHMASSHLKQSMAKAIFQNGADSKYHTIDRQDELLTTSKKTKLSEKKQNRKLNIKDL